MRNTILSFKEARYKKKILIASGKKFLNTILVVIKYNFFLRTLKKTIKY